MASMTYVGPDDKLFGGKAIVEYVCPLDGRRHPGTVFVQFDGACTPDITPHRLRFLPLMYGWHPFPRKSFVKFRRPVRRM